MLITCIIYASLDSRHLRDVSFPATGTQGYQIFILSHRGCHYIAHLPPVKAMPLARWLTILIARIIAQENLGILVAAVPPGQVSEDPAQI